MLDPRQLSRVLSIWFDFGNERVCHRDVCSSHRSAPLASSKSSASIGIAGMLIFFWPLHCCSPACPLLFGKPGRDLDESADCCGKTPSWPGKQRDLLFIPSPVLLPDEGERFGDLTLSRKLGMNFVRWDVVKAIPQLGWMMVPGWMRVPGWKLGFLNPAPA